MNPNDLKVTLSNLAEHKQYSTVRQISADAGYGRGAEATLTIVNVASGEIWQVHYRPFLNTSIDEQILGRWYPVEARATVTYEPKGTAAATMAGEGGTSLPRFVTCAAVAPMLVDLILGELSSLVRPAVQNHVTSCLACTANLTVLRMAMAADLADEE